MEMSKNSTVSYEYLQDYEVFRKEKMFEIIYSHKYILIGYNIIFKLPQIKKKKTLSIAIKLIGPAT